ncbi:MAG TPA: hypothetical protein HPP87_10020 [Planctomycetes bacterium]|nr:hypothetical protein [Planctomycetota bacterium]
MKPLIFIVLKIVEIAVFVFVPYGFGRLAIYLGVFRMIGVVDTWMCGCLAVLAPIVAVVFAMALVAGNWKLTKCIYKRIKEK